MEVLPLKYIIVALVLALVVGLILAMRAPTSETLDSTIRCGQCICR